MSIRFDENDIRPMGRTAMGVKGITLSEWWWSCIYELMWWRYMMY